MIEKLHLRTHSTEKEAEINTKNIESILNKMIVGDLPNLEKEIDI